jgi:phage/plasmid-associated DNA primase
VELLTEDDPIHRLQNHVIQNQEEVTKMNFYEIYDVWCRDNAEKQLVAKSFSSYLIQYQKDYNLEYNKVRNKQGRRVWGFWGVEPLIQIYG